MTDAQAPRDPWSKFYWRDWRSDQQLRNCGLAARGLWLEILAIMHAANPVGHLLVNGHPPTDHQLALQVGASVADVRRLKAELLAAGVPDVIDGVWISRRMVRDTKRRAVNRENGSAGGNPKLKDKSLDNQIGYPNRITKPDKPSDKSHDARDPEARSQIPERDNPEASQQRDAARCEDDTLALAKRAAAVSAELKTICDTDENRHPAWAVISPIVGWLQAGADPNLDVYPAAKAVMARRNGKGAPSSPSYLTQPVLDAMRSRLAGSAPAPAAAVDESPPDPIREEAAKKMIKAMDVWRENGRQGPMPTVEDHMPKANGAAI